METIKAFGFVLSSVFFRRQQFINVTKNLHVAISSTNKINAFRIPLSTKEVFGQRGELEPAERGKKTYVKEAEESVKMKYSNIRSIFPEELKNIKTMKNTVCEFRDLESSFAIPNKTGAKTLRLQMNFLGLSMVKKTDAAALTMVFVMIIIR